MSGPLTAQTDEIRPDLASEAAGPAAEQARADAYRRRLLDGLQASVEERGLLNTTVADIVRHAHTSRRTFYEHFADRAACFQALVQRHTDLTWQAVLSAVDTSQAPHERLRRGIAAMCGSLAARPALSVSSVRDLPSLSPAARELQRRLLDSTATMLVGLMEAARPDDGRSAEQRLLLGRLAFGGMREIVACTVEDGGDLRDKADELTDAVQRVLDIPA